MMNRLITLAALLIISAGLSAQQVDMSLIPFREGNKWGYSDPNKRIVIKPAYDDAQWFSEGYAAVKMGSRWGYINKAGKLVIPARYTVAKSFRKGFVPRAGKEGGDSVLFAGVSMKADGYEVCINTRGVTSARCPAIAESSVPENNIPVGTVVQQKNYSVPNNNGLFDRIVDDYKMTGSDETYYIAVKNNLYGVFNTKFDTIVPFEYTDIKLVRSSTPYLQVQKNGMYGIISGIGQMRIMPEYTSVFPVRSSTGKEYLIIKKGGKTYVRDFDNNVLIGDGYSDIVYDADGGFILTGNDNMKGYYFSDNTVVAPKYSDIRLVNGTRYLLVKTFSGKLGYISPSGNEYFVE